MVLEAPACAKSNCEIPIDKHMDLQFQSKVRNSSLQLGNSECRIISTHSRSLIFGMEMRVPVERTWVVQHEMMTRSVLVIERDGDGYSKVNDWLGELLLERA